MVYYFPVTSRIIEKPIMITTNTIIETTDPAQVQLLESIELMGQIQTVTVWLLCLLALAAVALFNYKLTDQSIKECEEQA